MIKTVINLDGTQEPFNAAKLNAWVRKATGDKVANIDWQTIAIETVKSMPEVVTTKELQKALIDRLLAGESWTHYKLAGRLMAKLIRNEVFAKDEYPSIREVQKNLQNLGLMRDLGYTDSEMNALEAIINHELDLDAPHFAHEQFRNKYAMRTVHTNTEYETQQYVYMRMAMTIFSDMPATPEDKIEEAVALCNEDTPYESRTRLEHVIRIYNLKSNKILSSPTPNYNNLGSFHLGYASCCVYMAIDNRFSLAAADHIAYLMTTQSAGLGENMSVRSISEPVQKGRFLHRGMKPYIDVQGKIARANIQGGRGGALHIQGSIFHQEAEMMVRLRDTRAEAKKGNREAQFGYLANGYFYAKAAKKEKIFTWNIHTAPMLHELFYSDDIFGFIAEYERLEKDPTFEKNYVDARDLLLTALNQTVGTGTIHGLDIGEMNRNTPFIDAIHSSNLCVEIKLPTQAYDGPMAMMDLYSDKEVGYVVLRGTNDKGETTTYRFTARKVIYLIDNKKFKVAAQNLKVGMKFRYYTDEVVVDEMLEVKKEPEVALCSLAAVNLTEELSEYQYKEATYYALREIDYCILNAEYVLPHVGFTAKQRMNAGVGLMGVATHMARRRLKYDTKEGLEEGHRIAERHYWWLTEASLAISKERGLAGWMEASKYQEGWLPHENVKPFVNTLADFKNVYDWDEKKARIIANRGLAHSVVCAYMPGESSSKALAAANSIYGIRRPVLIKTDGENVMRWAAPYSDDPAYFYQSFWDISVYAQNSWYAVFQKWCDQMISADWFEDFNKRRMIPSSELLNYEFDRIKKGVASRYYFNSLVPSKGDTLKSDGASILDELKQNAPRTKTETELLAEKLMGGISNEQEVCEGCQV